MTATITPAAAAEQLAGLEPGVAVRMLVNRLAAERGLDAPWDTPPHDHLPALPDIEAIGEVHQLLLGGQDQARGLQGSYYTPDLLARFISRFSLEIALELGDEPDDVLHVLAVDPACGAGVLLVAAAHHLAREYATRATGTPDPARTITTTGHQSLVGWTDPPAVDDCTFRMLTPGEIQAAMAFGSAYRVLGNRRERVRQLGNAVTPPAAEYLIRAVVASLGEAS